MDYSWITADFLNYDNGVDSPSCMTVFAADQGLTDLARSDFWCVDGTFNSAPLLFHRYMSFVRRSGIC